MAKKSSTHSARNNLPVIVLIIIGTIVWSITMVKSGLVYSYGMGFWGPNGHDGVWHIALAESLKSGSLQIPVFAGEQINNYHIGYDILLAGLSKATTIPITTLYFQILPPTTALLIGIISYRLVRLWTKSSLAAFWSTFFIYFGGGFGWLITLLRSGELGGESLFWAQQATSTLLNPPFALSLLLLLLGLLLLLKHNKQYSKTNIILAILIFSVLSQIKIYASILVLASLFIAGVWRYIKENRLDILSIFFITSLLSVIIFFPLNSSSTNLVVFKPFWFLENLMYSPDRFYWPRLYSAMTTFTSGGIWVKALIAYSAAFVIFWIGNMGTRIIHEVLIIKWLRSLKKITFIEIFCISMIVIGTVIPMLFIQKGTPWNTIQFFYYSLVFAGILAGISFADIIKSQKRGTQIISIVILVVLTIPTTISTLKHYLPSRPPAKLSLQELDALSFLASQQAGTVLTQGFDKSAADAAVSNPPRPLYLYESTAYVSAYSQKPGYLQDQVNLNITAYDWQDRLEILEDIYNTKDHNKINSFLQQNNISYIYQIKKQIPQIEPTSSLTSIYTNQDVEIFKVKH